MRTKLIRVLALLMAVGLIAAACGSDDSDSSSSDESTDEATDEATEEATEEAAASGGEFEAVSISIGGVLPETGALGELGVPMIEAAKLAVEDINAEGGDVTYTFEDSGTNPEVAGPGVDRLLSGGSQVIMGAGASGVTATFMQVLADGEIAQCSPSNTNPTINQEDFAAFYVRTSPSDNGVAPIMSDEIVADGGTRVAIVARADDYGDALAGLVAADLDSLGVESEIISYDPEATSFESTVENVTAYGPDKVLNIGFFFDGTAVIKGLIESGISAEDMYGSDGLFLPSIPTTMGDPNLLDGMKVFGATGDPAFNERLTVITDGNLIYGGNAYDCMVLLALAGQTTGDPADGPSMIEALIALTGGEVECTSFGECAGLIAAGESVDYVGASGEINFDELGDPTTANFAVVQWQDGDFVPLSVSAVDLAETS